MKRYDPRIAISGNSSTARPLHVGRPHKRRVVQGGDDAQIIDFVADLARQLDVPLEAVFPALKMFVIGATQRFPQRVMSWSELVASGFDVNDLPSLKACVEFKIIDPLRCQQDGSEQYYGISVKTAGIADTRLNAEFLMDWPSAAKFMHWTFVTAPFAAPVDRAAAALLASHQELVISV